jgi:hypothetical protein
MYPSNNYLSYNPNDFSTDLPTQSSFHNVNQQFIGNNAIKNDFDISSARSLIGVFVELNFYFNFISEPNELFCSSSTSYPTSATNFPIPAHASGKKRK